MANGAEILPIDFAAQAYSRSCWRGFEQCLFERMKEPDLDLLAEFARAFGINRQFPAKEGVPRNISYQPVLDDLEKFARPKDQKDLIKAVKRLSEAARSDGDALSAASKFVWAKSPDLGIIYDSRARRSLSRYRRSTGVTKGRITDYETFVKVWSKLFSQREQELVSACRTHGLTDAWAPRRILDYWLYLNGPTPKAPSKPKA